MNTVVETPLLNWINSHDCGVTPTGVMNDDGTITIRAQGVSSDGTVTQVEDTVRSYTEARAVLGY